MLDQRQVGDHADSAARPSSPARGIAGQIVANTSLLVAVLVYMGWAYDTAFYGYFHLNPLYLDIGIVEYMLVSLSLFSPVLVIVAAIAILVSAGQTWHLQGTRLGGSVGVLGRLGVHFLGRLISQDAREQRQLGRRLLIGLGSAVTVIGVSLALTARFARVNTYVVLGLLGGGSLLLTSPTRSDRHGRLPYALAVVLAAVCTLWAGSLYATYLGKHAAEEVALDLSARTAVTLYSAQPLALNGPGVHIKSLPVGSLYHYRYQGLRLLTLRSGNYYLLPVGWTPHQDFTYVIKDSGQPRVELH